MDLSEVREQKTNSKNTTSRKVHESHEKHKSPANNEEPESQKTTWKVQGLGFRDVEIRLRMYWFGKPLCAECGALGPRFRIPSKVPEFFYHI